MPEGPSIILLREQVKRFAGRKILDAVGNAKIDMSRLIGRKVVAFRSWGKHFLIELPDVAVRVHFLMFGSYTIDSRKDRDPRLRLSFRGGEVNFYSCAIRLVEGPLDDTYDWSVDVMSPSWDAAAARRALRSMPETLICDALLDQNLFSGVGNIIKNEVLFRVRVHPCSAVGALPPAKLRAVIEEARNYSFEFLEWKRRFVLRKHWLVHNKGTCPNCQGKLRREWLGTTNRRTFFCPRCQKRYELKPSPGRTAARRKAPAASHRHRATPRKRKT